MVTELSKVQFGLKSYACMILKSDEWVTREFDLKSRAKFYTKIARLDVQLPLYYSHFEIAEFS